MRVAVIGLAATGLSSARVLAARGETLFLCDAKPESALDPHRVAEARALSGVTLLLNTKTLPPDVELVIPSPGVPRTAAPLIEAQAQGIEIASEIEVAYRLAQAPIVAITGTNGKTTTTAMLGSICQQAGLPTFIAGNIAEDHGKRLPLIEAAVAASSDAVIVAEISSFQLEWVSQFRPKVAAWLNLSNDHLDRYMSLEEYGQVKARIFAAQTPSDFAVVNADDPLVMRLSEGVGQGVRLPFATLDPSLQLCAPGQHNRANAAAAQAIATALGIRPDAITTALRQFNGVAHRMELVEEKRGVRFINNSMCTNPAAVAASVSAVAGGLIAIAGGRHKGGELDTMVRAFAEHARHVVLIGEQGPLLGEALARAGFTATEQARDMDEAVQRAARVARAGETVLLVPGFASFDMFTGFEQRGQAFRAAVGRL